MKFSAGDKVSFINEKQNGIVVKAFPGGKVLVEIEDGFEIEVMEKELVKIGNSNYIESTKEEAILPVIPEESTSSLLLLCENDIICFAAVPAATGAVLTGMVNYFLLNNTAYDLVFTFFSKKKNKKEGLARGILEQKSEILLVSYLRNDLTEIEEFEIEALIFYTDKRPAISHIRKQIGIVLPGIAHTNPGASGVAAFAKTVELFSEKEHDTVVMRDLVAKLATKTNEPVITAKHSLKMQDKNKFGILVNEKEVDLHIEELQPDFSNLSNAEMISIQMKHFANEMDNAIRNHYKRIIFIHGVGNGVLKREIRQELRKYNGVTVRDGDFSKYGNGATEVNWI